MNKKMRRGQAAMEFLMTYGWAILVVLAAIGALAYFGVLSPDNFLPERCTISPEFGCLEHQVTAESSSGAGDGTVILGIQNNVGSSLQAVNVSVTDPDSGADLCTPWVNYTSVSNGQRLGAGTVTLTGCSTGNEGDRFQGDIEIDYRESNSDLVHPRAGTLQSQVVQ